MKRSLCLSVLLPLLASFQAPGDGSAACEPHWIPTFGGEPGGSYSFQAILSHNDGSGAGPTIYAGGFFTFVGGVAANYIAKFDGVSWSPLGSGTSSLVTDLVVHDDGSGAGPALFAAGTFTGAGGLPANRIAKWDGSSWSPLGSGLDGTVRALAVYDDGSGPALFAAGVFTSAGGAPANRIARWDGTTWSPLGSGTSGPVHALEVFDDGTGPALFAGGEFATAGGITANHVAKWDGATWSPVGGGMTWTGDVFDPTPRINALVGLDTGNGPELYAGGVFQIAGGVAIKGLASWDGTSWSPLGSGTDGQVNALAVLDDGGGPALYAGGQLWGIDGVNTPGPAKWDGTSWSPTGSGIPGTVWALAAHDDGQGEVLLVGGQFAAAGGVPATSIARWDGSAWSQLGSGLDKLVNALTIHDDGLGGGPALYAGGLFLGAGGVTLNRIGRWDGASWSPLGSGMNNAVGALAVHDDGSGGGAALYAAGSFTSAGGAPANRIARWDGVSWSRRSGAD